MKKEHVNLSKEQQTVVDTIEGQLAVISCPGSGKTTLIIERVYHMISSNIDASNILVVTFTKEAARQMKERYYEKYGPASVMFGTIHSLCYKVLHSSYGLNSENIISQNDAEKVVLEILNKQKIQVGNRLEYSRNMLAEISFVRNSAINYKSHKPDSINPADFCTVFEKYVEYKKAHQKVDYDDMLWMCRNSFRMKPEILQVWKDQYPYILIDEYQDINKVQADIFYMLAGDNGNICVVGDDDQSCYRFRGADSTVFLDFPKHYPDAKVFYLSTNYRSCVKIVKAAKNLIENNQKRYEKKFNVSSTKMGKVLAHLTDTESTNYTIQLIQNLRKHGYQFEDIAILYRVNSQNQVLAGKLMKYNIPFYTTDPIVDYHKDVIFRDIMAYWHIANHSGTNKDLMQILNHPNRFLRKSLFENCSVDRQEILRIARENDLSSNSIDNIMKLFHDLSILESRNPKEFMDFLIFHMDYEQAVIQNSRWCQKDETAQMELLENLREEARSFSSMDDWEQYASYYSEQINESQKKDGICLSTLHSSKGLEWPCVIIIGASSEMYPYKKARSLEDQEEERRLFYVGMTRAKNECHICGTKTNPTPYLYEIGLLKK